MKVSGKQHGNVTTGKVIVNTPSGTYVDGKKADDPKGTKSK